MFVVVLMGMRALCLFVSNQDYQYEAACVTCAELTEHTRTASCINCILHKLDVHNCTASLIGVSNGSINNPKHEPQCMYV
jgi:alpha-N-acetylglucosamine transferase